jgi:hypothetical protein
MQHNGWDHALKVTADGKGLVGHAGAVLLRKAADQAGLTGQLSAALLRKGTSPLLDRGGVLVSLAIAIALGATSMSDIALLAHLAPVLGTAPSGPTVRRALDLAGTPAALDKIARARARARDHAWKLIEATPAGFPWLVIAGKTLTGWLVIDMDATLVTARSDKEGAAATWKKGYGFHPLGAWCASTRECLAMLLRPGNAGSNTFTRHAPLPDLAHPRPPRPPRPAADPRHQPRLALERGIPYLLAAALRPASTILTSTNQPSDAKGGPARRGRSRCAPGHPGHATHPAPQGQTDMRPKNGCQHNQ